MFNLSKKDFSKLDKLLLFSVIFLVVFGLLVLNSAINYMGYFSMKSQFISTFLGAFSVAILLVMDLDFFKKIKWLIYLVTLGLLLATTFFGFGMEEWGANSWVQFGPVTLQPAEFVKIGLIVFLAAYLDEIKEDLNKPWVLIKSLLVSFFPVVLILLQPDFGTAMVYVFFIGVMYFIAGIDWKYIGLAFLIVLLSIPVIWDGMDLYQKNRILNFGDKERDVSDSGLQVHQGIIAIGSGQLKGRGYKEGPQSQNGFIPEQHTDSIFPVLAEEFGFLGAGLVLVLYFIMLFRMIKISIKAKTSFERLLAIGITALFFIHIFENVGMTLGIMPMTGIPLPFFSNGGTAQIMNLISVGLVLSISAQREALDF